MAKKEKTPQKARPKKVARKQKARQAVASTKKSEDSGGGSTAGPVGWISRSIQFLREVRVEFDKVTWPTRKEAFALTAVVLAVTFFFTAYLGLVDISLSKFVSFLIY